MLWRPLSREIFQFAPQLKRDSLGTPPPFEEYKEREETMPPTQSRVIPVLTSTLFLAMVQACAHSRSQQVTPHVGSCAAPILTVHNNTNRDVEVYEYRSGVKTIIATVSPGTHKVSLPSDDPRLSYGVQPVGGTEVLTATSRSRTSDNVTLERGCE